ncbi:AraC family transcriptional regulator [Oceanobacillus sp. J11TS1]|uniref:AraC family transcriptional regulator n=1 Tax=Oceanobacillus sp. J11TS1 TaxID=2807191 RepID=UPI001B21B559|nr:AraC family transcriptional regulator [Oceanobacillus sp. J11TS1]GIO23759.1 AraC family transcriptional regulator [Oceanobacillus sp. J11TS1]
MEYKYEVMQNDDKVPVKVVIYEREEHQFIPRHWHETIEISYIISGQVQEIYIDGANYTVKGGDIVLINSNSIHSVFVDQDRGFKGVTFFIPIEFLTENTENDNQITFNCISIGEKDEARIKQFAELRNVLDSMVEAYENAKKDSLAFIRFKGLSYELIYILLKYFKINEKRMGIIKTEKYLERLTKITNYIKENYNQNLTIELIANKFNLSSAYLSRFFLKHMGMTVLGYINAIRLEKSYRDLLNTDNSIIYIALENGFPNEKSFNRVFKSVYKVTPGQYRKENKMKK